MKKLTLIFGCMLVASLISCKSEEKNPEPVTEETSENIQSASTSVSAGDANEAAQQKKESSVSTENSKATQPVATESKNENATASVAPPASNAAAGATPPWAGTYKGLLPCPDCPGVETTLILRTDRVYELRKNFIGKKVDRPFVAKGPFEWINDNTVALLGVPTGPNKYLVSENSLTQLDVNGSLITGADANKFVLSKSN